MSRVLDEIARLDAAVVAGTETPAHAVARLDGAAIGAACFRLAPATEVAARLVAAAPGIARGVLTMSLAEARGLVADGLSVILAVDETEAEDVPLMQRLSGVVALASGLTGHAAIVSRALGIPCVLGSARAHVDAGALVLREVAKRVGPGSFLGLCGATGAVFVEPFAYVGPTTELAAVGRWLDAVGAPAVEASVVTEAERTLAQAMGVVARTMPRELPDDPARLSRIAPGWPRPEESGSPPPVPVLRAVAARLERSRSRA